MQLPQHFDSLRSLSASALGSFWQKLTAVQRISLISLMFFVLIIPIAVWLALNPTNLFSRASVGVVPVTPPTSSPLPSPTPSPSPSPTTLSQIFNIGRGFSLVGLTIDKGTQYFGEDFLQDLNASFSASTIPGKTTPAGNKVLNVFHYDASMGRWQIHTLGSTTDDHFVVRAGQGFFIRSIWSGTSTISGVQATLYSQVILKGWNLISLPSASFANAEALLQAMKSQDIDVDLIARFSGGSYDIHPIGSEANNFEITPGEGYWVRNKGNVRSFTVTPFYPTPGVYTTPYLDNNYNTPYSTPAYATPKTKEYSTPTYSYPTPQ